MHPKPLFVPLFLALAIYGAGATAQNQANPAQSSPEKRIETIDALMAAYRRQAAEKGGIDNGALRAIEGGVRTARSQIEAGHHDEATASLDPLYQQLKQMIAQLQKPSDLKSGSAAVAEAQQRQSAQTDSPQLRATYDRRVASIDALLQAWQRVASEKKLSDSGLAGAQAGLAEARKLADARSYPAAIAALEAVYERARTSMIQLRNGEQLVDSKIFGSQAEEFRYELVRNQDYLRLISELAASGKNAAWLATSEKCRNLREDAEKTAARGQYDAALTVIGNATIELKGVLKQAGFPIL